MTPRRNGPRSTNPVLDLVRLFPPKPVIGCVHLLPTPGTPHYRGSIHEITEVALSEAATLCACGVDALIVENFRDAPLSPGAVTPATVACMAVVTDAIATTAAIPVGVAVLRNDATAAMSIAAATGAAFIRINVHVGVALTAQGVIEGQSWETLRLRRELGCDVRILADAQVKHSRQIAFRSLGDELAALEPHCDGIIVSGHVTGRPTRLSDLTLAKTRCEKPVFVGTGVTLENVAEYFEEADGFIVGSHFKESGDTGNRVNAARAQAFMDRVHELRAKLH